MSINRKARRAQERLQRARRTSDASAMQARVQAAGHEVQRLSAMAQCVQSALGLASQIPVIPPVEGVTYAPEDDPNFFRTAAIEDFGDRLDEVRMKLIHANEEMYLALEALDPADAPLVAVAPASVLA